MIFKGAKHQSTLDVATSLSNTDMGTKAHPGGAIRGGVDELENLKKLLLKPTAIRISPRTPNSSQEEPMPANGVTTSPNTLPPTPVAPKAAPVPSGAISQPMRPSPSRPSAKPQYLAVLNSIPDYHPLSGRSGFGDDTDETEQPRGRIFWRFYGAAVIAVSLCLFLSGCGKGAPDDPSRKEAADSSQELEQTIKDLDGIQSDIHSYLLGDSRARLCLVERETTAFSKSFDDIVSRMNGMIAADKDFAATGKLGSGYKTGRDLVNDSQALAAQSHQAMSGAKIIYDLLVSSTSDRDAFKTRADLAWFKVLKRSSAATPWYNYEKSKGGDAATKADARMKPMLSNVDFAKQLHNRINIAYADASHGRYYDCSNWALDVIKIEKTAVSVDTVATSMEKDWHPAEGAGVINDPDRNVVRGSELKPNTNAPTASSVDQGETSDDQPTSNGETDSSTSAIKPDQTNPLNVRPEAPPQQ